MNHQEYGISLYYCYLTIDNVPEQVEWQEELCRSLGLKGRIRVSTEGLNGVLSGRCPNLVEYEEQTCGFLKVSKQVLDVKHCQLRTDLPVEAQLFDALLVKATRNVIGLFEPKGPEVERNQTIAQPENPKRYYRRRRRNRQKQTPQQQQQQQQQQQENDDDGTTIEPAVHLSPQEWQESLLRHVRSEDAVLLDARNLYESRIGNFRVEGIPTVLPHTRQYSSLPNVLKRHKDVLKDKHVYMYCTGGVRCEQVSVYLQKLLPNNPPMYQLRGGIQRYLETFDDDTQNDTTTTCAGSSSSSSLFRGKNFVFDPRRTDPMVRGSAETGRCLVCGTSHDDYDNGKAPQQKQESRCCKCRGLILVCNQCRPTVQTWGQEKEQEENGDNTLPQVFCGLTECIQEGSTNEITILE